MDPSCDAYFSGSISPNSLFLFPSFLAVSTFLYFLLRYLEWDRILLKYIYAILDAPILLQILFVLLTYEMVFWIFLSIILHSSKFTELEIKPLVSFQVLQFVPATPVYVSYELKLLCYEIPYKFLVAVSMVLKSQSSQKCEILSISFYVVRIYGDFKGSPRLLSGLFHLGNDLNCEQKGTDSVLRQALYSCALCNQTIGLSLLP